MVAGEMPAAGLRGGRRDPAKAGAATRPPSGCPLAASSRGRSQLLAFLILQLITPFVFREREELQLGDNRHQLQGHGWITGWVFSLPAPQNPVLGSSRGCVSTKRTPARKLELIRKAAHCNSQRCNTWSPPGQAHGTKLASSRLERDPCPGVYQILCPGMVALAASGAKSGLQVAWSCRQPSLLTLPLAALGSQSRSAGRAASSLPSAARGFRQGAPTQLPPSPASKQALLRGPAPSKVATWPAPSKAVTAQIRPPHSPVAPGRLMASCSQARCATYLSFLLP